MATTIKPTIQHILLVPVGGMFEDSQYIFKENRTDFNECTLMYKPDYFFNRYSNSSNGLVNFIRNNCDKASSFCWSKLYTLDIDQRIQMQKELFTMLDNTNPNTVAINTTTTIKYSVTKDKGMLLRIIGDHRSSTNLKPELVSYQRSHSGQQRAFVWLILKCSADELPNLIASQQYTELFCLLNHLYLADSIHPRIRLSIDFNNLNINLTSVPVSNSFRHEIIAWRKETVEIATPKRIYPAQEKVGEKIFNTIVNQITDFDSRYDKFKFYLVLPPRRSLRTQSLARMKTVLDQMERRYLCTGTNDISSLTYLINPANRNQFKSDVIDEATNPENKRTMYLIIQDECHWGMKFDSVADKHFINQKDLLDEELSDNIYILQVSATPYNIEAITDFRRNNIIQWDEAVKDISTNYEGRLQLIQTKKIQPQSQESKNCMLKFEKYYSSIAYLSANRTDGYLSLPELNIVCEYIVTLHYILASKQNEDNHSLFSDELKNFVTRETQEILGSLCDEGENGKGYLAVLRLNTVATAINLRRSLKQLMKLYNQPDLFDVIVDADDQEDCLYDRLSKASKDKYKTWWNKSNELTEEEKEDFGYDNLKYLPLLLIVIEKGRMGDTFPSESFRYFDLRARYQKDILRSTCYCSLLQDVGRAFGYPTVNNERPTVFMGNEIFDLLNKNELQPHETLKRNEETGENLTPATTTDAVTTNYPNSIYVDLDRYWMPNKLHPLGPQAAQSKREAHKNVAYRRFLLSAHPQIGKTASFLWAVHLFVDHFKKPEYELMNRKQNKYFKTLYGFRTLDSGELHDKLVDNEQLQKDWDQFHEDAASIYDVWENEPDEIVPIKKCITIIEQLTQNLSENDDIVIIDMGCGLAKLAQHFKPVNNMRVISIDHRRHPLVPSDIVVLEADMKNVTETIREKKITADFVVFSLSLWGNAENITKYIHVATDLLKLNGYMILIDAKNNIVNNNNLENYVISLLNEEKRLRYRVSTERPNSRFFCIVAERRQELKF